MPPEIVLEEVYDFVAQNKLDMAIDRIFAYANASFWSGHFKNIDEMFVLCDLDKLGKEVALGLLTTGHWARAELEQREWFVIKVENWLLLTEDQARVDSLLLGLR